VGLILYAARMSCFQTTPESQKILDDLTLAAELKTALVDEFPTSEVTAKDGSGFVKIELPLSQQQKATDRIKQIAETVPGVKVIDVHVIPLMGAD